MTIIRHNLDDNIRFLRHSRLGNDGCMIQMGSFQPAKLEF